MSFQIQALSPEPFHALFALSDAELAAQNMHRMTVDAFPGSPCRISLEDAQLGETVLLLNYAHQDADTPYKASYAIYVREGASQATLAAGHVPEVLRIRLISMRLFDQNGMMIDADVVEGEVLCDALQAAFTDKNVAYAHLHFAKRGCFAASVTRTG